MTAKPILILALLLLTLPGAFTPVRAERLPIRTFSSADGLASGFVDNIYRDSRGFMWFCTRNGLSRFDGARFVNYQIDESGTAVSVEAIFETRTGDYFVSTTSGTYWFRGDAVSNAGPTKLNAQLVSTNRGSFLQASDGTVWMSSSAVFRIDMIDGTPVLTEVDWKIPEKDSTNFDTYGIVQTPDLSLWLFSSWGLARKLPDGRMIVYQTDRRLYAGNGTVAMDTDTAGRIWISIGDSLLVLNPDPFGSVAAAGEVILRQLESSRRIVIRPGIAIEPPPPGTIIEYRLEDDLSVRRMYNDAAGNMWLTATGRLYKITDWLPTLYSTDQGLPESISRIADDIAGNIWIGGHTSLIRLDRGGLTTFGRADGAVGNRFASIGEDAAGNLLFANASASIARLEGNRIESAQLQSEATVEHLWTSRFMMVDRSDRLWLLTSNGLFRFDGASKFDQLKRGVPSRIYNVADGLKSDVLFQIFEDSRGDIWVSTRGPSTREVGLARLDKATDRFRTFDESGGFPPSKSASSYAEDRAGNIWFTFYEGGLARFDGSKFRIFEPGGEIPTALLTDLHVDRAGRLWVGSSVRGLLRVDDPTAAEPTFINFSTANGLTSNNVRTITEDLFGRIYLGTASGVDCLTPESGHVRHFSVNDGLAADFVVDSYRDRAGNIWFATNNGVSRLIPVPNERRTPPPIMISGLRIAGFDQSIEKLGTALVERGDLTHTENGLQIEFFGIDFHAGEVLRFQYKLDGVDQDWGPPTEQRSVTFANLSPGSYRFMVRAVASDGLSSARPAMVTFRILPPIWARWWFMTLVGIFVAGLVTAFYSYRLARLREVNSALEEARRAEEKLRHSREERLAELEQVRSRIATDLHDDIGASLTQIAILSEVAQAQSQNGGSEPLKQITNVSNELVGTMSDIVWSINPQKDHFSDLTQRMRRFASDVLSAKRIGLHFEASHETDSVILNSNIRREVFLVFKEAINNVVKHSGATRVEVIVGFELGEMRLLIRDDGNGFEFDAVDSSDGGNGVPSMKRRANAIAGRLEIDSAKESGTVIRLFVPIDRTTRMGGDGKETTL